LFRKFLINNINVINLQYINQAVVLLVKRDDNIPNVRAFGFTKPKSLNKQGFSLTGINTIIDCVRKSSAWLKLYKRYNSNILN